jgi:beta-N-acetylhexosaminidase
MGQLIVGIAGFDLTAEERAVLVHPRIAGVILFSRNFRDPIQLAALNADIHALRPDMPLQIYVDQEGGRVQRFREGFTALPALGSLGTDGDAFDAAVTMVSELKAVGVDYSFAPVVDLDRGSQVIGSRAFSAEPESVIARAEAYIAGMQSQGMAPIIKHFPGHGTAVNDTHIAIAEDARSLAHIFATDLLPFAHFIHNRVFGVMISHVIYPEVDALPASVSTVWIQDVLRGQLQFEGKIFSDDLGMQAIRAWGTALELVQQVFAAGADYALLCNDWTEVIEVIRGLEWR